MQRNLRIDLLLAMLISLAITCFVQQDVFTDRNQINDDVRNQIYWMAQQNDKELFQDDLIAAYFTQYRMVSTPLKFFYALFPDHIDPKIISQFLPFILVLLATFYLFKFAETIANPKYAFWLCLVFNLYLWTAKVMSGGLPRAFFFPLFFLFLYLYVSRSWIWLVLALVLQTQIYPITFYISLTVLGLEMILNKIQKSSFSKGHFYSFISSVVLGILALYFRYVYKQSSLFGPLTTLKEALNMPEFFVEGRIKAFLIPYEAFHRGFSWDLFQKYQENFVSVGITILIVMSVLFCLIILYQKKIAKKAAPLIIPRVLWTSVISAICLSIVASLSLFYLYLPQRYLEYGLPLIGIFIAAALLYQLEQLFNRNKAFIKIGLIIICVSVMAPFWDDDLSNISKREDAVYDFLRTLRKDALILAPYDISSDVPAYAFRSVLVSHEGYIPFHKEYYKEMQHRKRVLERVYDAEDLAYVKKVIEEYGVDYFVVDKKDDEHRKITSVFNNLPDKCLVFKSNAFSVGSSEKLLGGCFEA